MRDSGMSGITRLLYRSFRSDWGRAAMSIAAIAAAIVLAVVLEVFKTGLGQQGRTYREELPRSSSSRASTPSNSLARAGREGLVGLAATLRQQARERQTPEQEEFYDWC